MSCKSTKKISEKLTCFAFRSFSVGRVLVTGYWVLGAGIFQPYFSLNTLVAEKTI